MIDQRLMLRLAHTAAEKSKAVVEKIKQSLAEEEDRRKKGIVRGFSGALEARSILQSSAPRNLFDFSNVAKTAQETIDKSVDIEEVPCAVNKAPDNVVDIVPETMEAEESDDVSDSDLEITAEKSKEEVIKEKIKEHIDLDDDSEEEETMTLTKV